MNKICLVIIFNHRYDGNIDILEKIYKGRFGSIYHLVPFYDGDKKNVIPVYGSSYQFQGYIAQGLRSFWDDKYTHYLFIGDDLILNPLIDQENIFEFFQVKDDSSFCYASQPLGEIEFWDYKNRIYNGPKTFGTDMGVNYQKEIMESEKAFKKMFDIGYKASSFTLNISQLIKCNMNKIKIILFILNHPIYVLNLLKGLKLPYPLFGGYSDIFLLHKKDIKKIANIFGVFAAMRLFVELAVPTAMKIYCEDLQEIGGREKVMWDPKEVEEIERAYNKDLKKLFTSWPEQCDYIHPIKLSKWEY